MAVRPSPKIELEHIELPIRGMDCAECVRHVREAIETVPGVKSAEVFLASEKAIVQFDPRQADLRNIHKAVEKAGYAVGKVVGSPLPLSPLTLSQRRFRKLLILVFGMVLGVVILGEWGGVFAILNSLIPLPAGALFVLLGGFPVFRNVLRSALKKQITSHTLMTLGVIAALVVGQWVTALIVVLFMRVGDMVERITTESARQAVKELTALAPQKARVERGGEEMEVPIGEVHVGDIVIVRPGEKIPVDGEVVAGQATVDQSSITGESIPIDVSKGSFVYAASIAALGSLKVKATRIGGDTTFGKVVQMVEEAEANRGHVQRIADRFSSFYLPVVTAIAALTFLISRNPLSTAAVLVVACSCSFALATPIAMLASMGASAKRGLLIKGGKYLEALARADVVLVDKTGTLTLGKPGLTEVLPLGNMDASQILTLAASAERYSEHPLAHAVRTAARDQSLPLLEPEEFEALPGIGVRARIKGLQVEVGNRTLLPPGANLPSQALFLESNLQSTGSTLLYVLLNGELIGVLAASDTLRPEVPKSIQELRNLNISHIELLTGDHEGTATSLSQQLGIPYRAELLPEDKIRIVKEYQARGHTVVMVGDGVNDAPALAQADVGIAMGAAGTDIAIEAAHIALMKEDWTLLPELFRIARRTMKVVKMNLAFTTVYNVIGLTLAATGVLPPVIAAAAQSLPDVGILLNSARLLRPPRSLPT